MNPNILGAETEQPSKEKIASKKLGEHALANAAFVQTSAAKVNLVPDNGEYADETAEPKRPLVIPNYPA